MVNTLYHGAKIGIIGAGQLGKMLAQSAQKMGYQVYFYDPNPTSCGFDVAQGHTVGQFDDREKLLDFVQTVDVVTYEFENIDGDLLQEIDAQAYLPQGTKLLLNGQERIKEKTWLNEQEIPTTQYKEITVIDDIDVDMGYPFILKTTRFGYDGKGQIKVDSDHDLTMKLEIIQNLLAEQPLIQEDYCDFAYEASIMVARDLQGNIKYFPISINQHEHGVLFSSLVGQTFDPVMTATIESIAGKIATAGNLVGVCGIEFFVSRAGDILVNEIAPRPHNSGHYTIEACNVSQFDQHILAITGHPLIDVRLMEPALMINILGQHLPRLAEGMAEFPNAIFHIYNKGEAKTQRKMGHFTITNPNFTDLADLLAISQTLKTWKRMY
jgi:5-(carboxyamino)imidazole ribonucleotide synthase